MNHALAAVLSISLSLLWFVPFVWCLWMMVTGSFRLRQRMCTLPGGQRLGLFWQGKVIAFAIRERPRQEDSRRLLRGWLGALALLMLMVVINVVLMASTSPHPHP
jgi:hypothetical protein